MDRQRRRLGQIKRWLDLEFPTSVPIRLWVGRMPQGYRDCLGTYHPPEGASDAIIRVARVSEDVYLGGYRLPISQQIDVLAHEWAHALADPAGEGAMRRNGGHTVWQFYPQLGRIEVAMGMALEGVLKRRE